MPQANIINKFYHSHANSSFRYKYPKSRNVNEIHTVTHTAKTMPKAQRYWRKNPKASHCGPSQKSDSKPGSSGIGEPSTPTMTPAFSNLILLILVLSCPISAVRCCWSFLSSSVVVMAPVLPLRFLLSKRPVREESFLAAETTWRVLNGARVILLLHVEVGKVMPWRRCCGSVVGLV